MKRTLLIACLILVTTSCSRIRVKRDYDDAFDFSTLKTFSWLERPEKPFEYLTNPVANRKQLDNYVRETVTRELERRGYLKTVVKPDFLVTHILEVQEKLYVHDMSYTTDFRVDKSVALPYRTGSLVLDFVDPTTSRLFWRGPASSVVADEQLDRYEVRQKVREAIKKILEEFPSNR